MVVWSHVSSCKLIFGRILLRKVGAVRLIVAASLGQIQVWFLIVAPTQRNIEVWRLDKSAVSQAACQDLRLAGDP